MLNDLNILYKYTSLFPKNGILENAALIKGLDAALHLPHILDKNIPAVFTFSQNITDTVQQAVITLSHCSKGAPTHAG